MFTKLKFQSRSKKVWNLWLINQYAIIIRSRLTNIHIEFAIISQLFLSIANPLHGSLELTLSIQNLVYIPSLCFVIFADLCNVDYAVQIALLTTQYK